MSILVTCGTGFVSRAFVRALREEHRDLRVLIRDPSKVSLFPTEKVLVGDLFDLSCLRRAVTGVETIVHVPPRVYPNGDGQSQLAMHRHAHVESTRLLIEAGVAEGLKKFLFVSSAHATGRDPEKTLCESSGGIPDTPYAQAKLAAERLIEAYAERHSIQAVILRPPSIYGPGDKSWVSSLFRAAQRNLWLPLKGIRAAHSLVFVDNLARAGLALLRVSRNGIGPGVFIVNDREDYRPDDLYAAVCQTLGKRIKTFQVPVPLLRAAAFTGVKFKQMPALRGLSLFRQLMIPQRYCGHLFDETVPDFSYVGFDEALQSMLTKSSAV